MRYQTRFKDIHHLAIMPITPTFVNGAFCINFCDPIRERDFAAYVTPREMAEFISRCSAALADQLGEQEPTKT
jgi:hypothetical protein